MDTVFRVAYSYLRCRDDADDVTQDVLIQLYRQDKAFESDAHVKNWLIRVTVNRCKNARWPRAGIPGKNFSASALVVASGLLETTAVFTPIFSSSARTSGMPGYGAVFTQLWAWYQSL